MKKNYFKNTIKFGIAAVLMMAVGSANAQSADGSTANTEQTAAAGETIKLIDNKGTIKYLQSNNGITTVTNTTNDKTTTTWQLGGTLIENTNIATGANEFKVTLDAGGTYVINGLIEETGIASDAGTIGTSGFTLLVRDEATGQTRKMLASNLVSGIRVEYTQGADAVADVPVTVTGLPALLAGTTDAKLFVYRNGIKLRSVTDFVAAVDEITVNYDAADLPMFAGDIIEVQYIK